MKKQRKNKHAGKRIAKSSQPRNSSQRKTSNILIQQKMKTKKFLKPERTFNSFKKEDLNDALAVRSMQEGYMSAFLQIKERYEPWLLHKITLMVGRQDIAQDCVSDILIKVYISINNYRMTNTLNSWISFITKNHMIDFSRKSDWKIKLSSVSLDFNIYSGEGDDQLPTLGAQLVDEDAISDSSLKMNEVRDVLNKAMATLDDNSINMLVKYYREEKTYAEIAEEENINLSTMKIHLLRAKLKLEEAIKRLFPEFTAEFKDTMKTLRRGGFIKLSSEEVHIDGEMIKIYSV